MEGIVYIYPREEQGGDNLKRSDGLFKSSKKIIGAKLGGKHCSSVEQPILEGGRHFSMRLFKQRLG